MCRKTFANRPNMKCVLLVAGHSTRLEAEVAADTSGRYASLIGTPKALFPGADGKPILDQWWAAISSATSISSDVFLVTVSSWLFLFVCVFGLC